MEKQHLTLTIPSWYGLIERRSGFEHILHIRYARHCGGGRRRRRDRSNGDDSTMQPTQSKRHTYVSLQWNNLLSSCAMNKQHRHLPSQVDRGWLNADASLNIPLIVVTLDTAVVVIVVVIVVMVMIRWCNQHKANDTHMWAYNKITCSHHVLWTNSTDTYHSKLKCHY